MKIPPHIEHIDCPDCAIRHVFAIVRQGKNTNLNCPWCEGEGVVREDGKKTLKTKPKLI